MKDFSAEWPVLTRFGEHEAIMNRLALYMDWGKVEEPEQGDLLLEHYKKDVGRLIRTLTAARTPTPEMAAAVMELAENHSEPVSAALRVMFFMFRLMNMAQGISLSGTEVLSPERMTRLLELAMGMLEQDSVAASSKLPCTECSELQDSISDLLMHMRSEHPHLNEGAETMNQENDGGGETQAGASAEVKKFGDGGQPAPDAEESGGAEGSPQGSPPETTEVPPAVADEPETDADAGKPNGPSEGPDEPITDAQSEPEKESDPTALDDVGGDGPPVSGPDAESMPETELTDPELTDHEAGKPEVDADADKVTEGDPPGPDAPLCANCNRNMQDDTAVFCVECWKNRALEEKTTVDDVARKNCIAIIAQMNDVTAHNHTKPQSWWADNLFTLHQFITSV